MFDLRKLFARDARPRKANEPDTDSDYNPSGRTGEGLEAEYERLIAAQFRRWGIEAGCVTVEVRRIGRAPDGFDVFIGMVRFVRYTRASSIRLLLGLPFLEARLRKRIRGKWMADYSHFGGLWVHASEQLCRSAKFGELRDLVVQLAPPRRYSDSSGHHARGGFDSSLHSDPSLGAESETGEASVSG